jgi:pre-mRNA cleavage complex 2 protein Pcf11
MADNAAEVAEDYRQALEDLTVNSRIEIATLTNIARENAHHGFAISEALANHIKKVCIGVPKAWMLYDDGYLWLCE